MSKDKTISNLINAYAKVYQEFEDLQNNHILSKGDQKTGVIGEYYAKLYLQSLPNVVSVDYANPGALHDLYCKLTDNLGEFKVQVKCVSAHSTTKTIAPINLSPGAFDELYLIALDKAFRPISFFINTYDEILKKAGNRPRLYGLKLKTQTTSSNLYLDLSDNKISDLKKVLELELSTPHPKPH